MGSAHFWQKFISFIVCITVSSLTLKFALTCVDLGVILISVICSFFRGSPPPSGVKCNLINCGVCKSKVYGINFYCQNLYDFSIKFHRDKTIVSGHLGLKLCTKYPGSDGVWSFLAEICKFYCAYCSVQSYLKICFNMCRSWSHFNQYNL